jgi:hypothetical protein
MLFILRLLGNQSLQTFFHLVYSPSLLSAPKQKVLMTRVAACHIQNSSTLEMTKERLSYDEARILALLESGLDLIR